MHADNGLLGTTIGEHSTELQDIADLDSFISAVGDKRVVMLGEASHGTSEFYLWRTLISQRLIREKGFQFIAVEGDWPDCYKLNRYVKGYDNAGNTAFGILKSFKRWPTWMWANREVERLIEWLKQYNDSKPTHMAGFYGLDVYSLWDSINAVVAYLDTVDPKAANEAREAYRCFEPYGYNEEVYAYSTSALRNCEAAVTQVLTDMLSKRKEYPTDSEAAFDAEQNAIIAKNAEEYYRVMLRGNTVSWNMRDRHMMDTLLRLLEHYGPDAKAIVWAHNTHVGDARFTDMKDAGMFNIGQLAREELGEDQIALLGFGMNEGSVIAGKAWEAPMEVMFAPRAMQGTWGNVLHSLDGKNRYICSAKFAGSPVQDQLLKQRAIGVVYHPGSEFGNYVPTQLFRRYDHFIHIDQTTALHPIHTTSINRSLLPETYPVSV